MTSKVPTSLHELVETGDYSDFSLVCEEQQFHLHRAIVCPQSPVIAAALSGEFRVRNPKVHHSQRQEALTHFQEAATKVVNVEGFDIETVRHMVSFLYTGEYHIHERPWSPPTEIEQSWGFLKKEGDQAEILLSHLRVNAIADYYAIQSMARLANTNIQSILENVEVVKVFPRFLQEASILTGDPSLQSILASTAANNIENLTKSQSFLDIDIQSTLAMKILSACATRIFELQTQLSTAQSSKIGEALCRYHVIGNIDNCIQVLKQTGECRNCHNSFGCFIEKHGKDHEPSYTLRCKICRCRHRGD